RENSPRHAVICTRPPGNGPAPVGPCHWHVLRWRLQDRRPRATEGGRHEIAEGTEAGIPEEGSTAEPRVRPAAARSGTSRRSGTGRRGARLRGRRGRERPVGPSGSSSMRPEYDIRFLLVWLLGVPSIVVLTWSLVSG